MRRAPLGSDGVSKYHWRPMVIRLRLPPSSCRANAWQAAVGLAEYLDRAEGVL